ncbi:MAG: hypothetical protein WKI04_17295 [Ferruginibacter sp.]
MQKELRLLSAFIVLLSMQYKSTAQMPVTVLQKKLQEYNINLELLRKEHPNHRKMPTIDFYLFGMGDRKKMVYKNGNLVDAVSGDTLYQWNINNEFIVPSEYYVYLKTTDGKEVHIFENEKGVYLEQGRSLKELSESFIHLPDFKGHFFAPVLKVLHHEILINIIDGKPVPNFFVYKNPWYRDATLMAKVLQQTGNLHLIKDWIMSIRDPFDRNNHGMSEADNLGEVLFLVSLVSDVSHPVVKTVLDSTRQFIKQGADGNYLEGKTDYALHPVFQTKWIKYGLKSLHLPDSFYIPKAYDSYSSFFGGITKPSMLPVPVLIKAAARIILTSFGRKTIFSVSKKE